MSRRWVPAKLFFFRLVWGSVEVAADSLAQGSSGLRLTPSTCPIGICLVAVALTGHPNRRPVERHAYPRLPFVPPWPTSGPRNTFFFGYNKETVRDQYSLRRRSSIIPRILPQGPRNGRGVQKRPRRVAGRTACPYLETIDILGPDGAPL